MTETRLPSVYFEMLLSYVTLAKTLNLSQAVKELNTTRQTIRRHIKDLETLRGGALFYYKERKYSLTDSGQKGLAEAHAVLNKANEWLLDETHVIGGLPTINTEFKDGFPFRAQCHPISKVWELGPSLLQEGLKAWMAAEFQIENPKLKKIRPYLVIYRKRGPEWIGVEIGLKSSFATWMGWDWAKSAIGSSFHNDPISSRADQFMIEAYETVARNGGVWYDHISTKLSRGASEKLVPVNYQRLVLAFYFPNGDPAVGALIARTNEISIEGVTLDKSMTMAQSDVM